MSDYLFRRKDADLSVFNPDAFRHNILKCKLTGSLSNKSADNILSNVSAMKIGTTDNEFVICVGNEFIQFRVIKQRGTEDRCIRVDTSCSNIIVGGDFYQPEDDWGIIHPNMIRSKCLILKPVYTKDVKLSHSHNINDKSGILGHEILNFDYRYNIRCFKVKDRSTNKYNPNGDYRLFDAIDYDTGKYNSFRVDYNVMRKMFRIRVYHYYEWSFIDS